MGQFASYSNWENYKCRTETDWFPVHFNTYKPWIFVLMKWNEQNSLCRWLWKTKLFFIPAHFLPSSKANIHTVETLDLHINQIITFYILLPKLTSGQTIPQKTSNSGHTVPILTIHGIGSWTILQTRNQSDWTIEILIIRTASENFHHSTVLLAPE